MVKTSKKFFRKFYGFQPSGGRFLDLANIHLVPGERYETLFRRIQTLFDECLHSPENGLRHHGEAIEQQEELSPLMEDTITITYIWLQTIDPGLPQLIKQRYATDLNSNTLASLQPQISQALPALIKEMQTSDSLQASRVVSSSSSRRQQPSQNQVNNDRICALCKASGRPAKGHFLQACPMLPPRDKEYLNKLRARAIELEEDEDAISVAAVDLERPVYGGTGDICMRSATDTPVRAQRVETSASPKLHASTANGMAWQSR